MKKSDYDTVFSFCKPIYKLIITVFSGCAFMDMEKVLIDILNFWI